MRYKYDFPSLHFDKNNIFNRLISKINKSNSELMTNIKYKKSDLMKFFLQRYIYIKW